MKSTILLALVATGCAIPLTEKVAALHAIDEDVRSFKEGLSAIEKSLHTLKAAASSAIEKSRMLPAGAAPNPDFVRWHNCPTAWCGAVKSSTIPGNTGPEKIETIKNVNDDMCCLTCRNAMVDGMMCGAWINDGEGHCILKFVDPSYAGGQFPTNVTYVPNAKSSAGIIKKCDTNTPPSPPDPPAPPPPPHTMCYEKCTKHMDRRTDWLDLKTAACKARCKGGRLHLVHNAAKATATATEATATEDLAADTAVDPPAPPPPPMGSCFSYCYAEYDLRDDWEDLKTRACDGQCGTVSGSQP